MAGESMRAKRDDFCVGRVLHEDDGFVTLEVAKDMSRTLQLEDGDRFLTVLFVHNTPTGVKAWKPWEHERPQ